MGSVTFLMSSLGWLAEEISLVGALVLDLRTEDVLPYGIGGFFCLDLDLT